MKFNKTTFIVEIDNDTTLRLRDVNGNIVYYIRDPKCTTVVSNNTIKIKQASESKIIELEFDSTGAANDAHTLLRNALKKLKDNLTDTTKTFHVFEENTPTTVWNIEHNLDKLVSVTTYDENGDEIIGDVTIIDDNNVQVNFNTPAIGKAIII